MEGATLLGAQGVKAGLADAVAAPDGAFDALPGELDERTARAAQPAARPAKPSPPRYAGNRWAGLVYWQEIRNALR